MAAGTARPRTAGRAPAVLLAGTVLLAATLAPSGGRTLAGPAAAGPLEPTLAAGRTFTIGPSHDGRSVNLRRGELLRVVLPSNAGTGYRWVIEAIDRQRLQLVEAELWSDPGPGGPGGRPLGLVGGPQQTTFLFRAVGTGESTLKLMLWPGAARAAASDPRLEVRVRSLAP